MKALKAGLQPSSSLKAKVLLVQDKVKNKGMVTNFSQNSFKNHMYLLFDVHDTNFKKYKRLFREQSVSQSIWQTSNTVFHELIHIPLSRSYIYIVYTFIYVHIIHNVQQLAFYFLFVWFFEGCCGWNPRPYSN
jgi:hypothetical protein